MGLKSKNPLKRAKEKFGIVTGKDVEREIQFMIDDILAHANKETLNEWSKIPSKGDKPTPEELIAYLVSEGCVEPKIEDMKEKNIDIKEC